MEEEVEKWTGASLWATVVLELLVAKGHKEFVSQVEKGPEVARAMARLDEAEDKMLEVIAQSCEKATEVV